MNGVDEAILVFYGVVAVSGLVFYREVGAKLRVWMAEMKRVFLEVPLRAITGRRRPDYAAIARLERDLFACESDAPPTAPGAPLPRVEELPAWAQAALKEIRAEAAYRARLRRGHP